MKHICNVAQEGRCKGEVGKCNHRRPHCVLPLFSVDFCTEERFCGIQDETVHCVESVLFPNINNLITVSEDLAREFVDWAHIWMKNGVSNEHICDRLATRFEEQLK